MPALCPPVFSICIGESHYTLCMKYISTIILIIDIPQKGGLLIKRMLEYGMNFYYQWYMPFGLNNITHQFKFGRNYQIWLNLPYIMTKFSYKLNVYLDYFKPAHQAGIQILRMKACIQIFMGNLGA